MLPKVATVDSMQGHESDIIILDWVNAYGDGLGFLKGNRRINVALSRARTSLIVFFSAPAIAVEDGKDVKDINGHSSLSKPGYLSNYRTTPPTG